MKTLLLPLLTLYGATAMGAGASEIIPTLEDAGYAYEATERCNTMSTTFDATRKLKRTSRFRDGRRIFRNAAEQWGQDWACKTALGNLGPDIDLSDYLMGRRVVQPLPSELPPLPVLKSEQLQGRTGAFSE